jgi:DNA polymerase III delta prime subunit
MSEELLLYKYQPIILNDFLMEKQTTECIQMMIKMDKMNFLFIGESGSGKTSILNVLMKEYYSNVSEREKENNVLFITSLKEQGIHYYRNELKIFCQTKSSIKNKKKMVLIDDIDMLNEPCQQIFRSYMDMFSSNVHFLASSYSIQKVLETLQSRFMIIRLNPLTKEQMFFLLDKIQEKENIFLEPGVKDFLLTISDHNAKTLIHFMEKFKLLGISTITLEIANQLCTTINFVLFEKYIEFVKNQDLDKAVKWLYSIYDKGYTVMDIWDCFFLFVKTTDVLTETEKYQWIPLICKYITIFHTIHEEEIELALFTNEVMKVFTFC